MTTDDERTNGMRTIVNHRTIRLRAETLVVLAIAPTWPASARCQASFYCATNRGCLLPSQGKCRP